MRREQKVQGKASVMPVDRAVGTSDGALVQTVLVCDDDEDIRVLVEAVLQEQGFAVRGATTVREAIGVIDRGGIDVVVTDIALPDGSGIEICHAARAAEAHVVAMTATVGPELAEQLEPCRAVMLSKPFSLSQLLTALAF